MRGITILLLSMFVCSGVYAQTNKQLRDSLAVVVKELSENPESTDLRLQKAGLNLRLEQWDYACNEYDWVLAHDSHNLSALYFRAYVYERQGKYSYARQDYQKLLAIVPGHFEAQLGLALLNQKDRHFTEALDMLNVLCAQHPDRSEAFAARAGVEKERGLNELAEYDFRQAINMEPDNTDYRISYIDLLIGMNRKADARDALDALVDKGVPRPNLEDLYQRAR